MADDVSTKVRTTVEKLLEADVTDQIARRGRELAAAVAEATEAVSARASEAWQDSAPQRRGAEKAARRAGKDAVKWSRRTWKKELRPTLSDIWGRRSAAIGATAAAIPAGRELVEDAAVRLGIRQRESRHWAAFFIGLLVGAAVGAIVALLTTPKPGREMRDELAVKARDAAEKAREEAGEWVPLFQREPTNGGVAAAIESTAAPIEDAVAPPETASTPIDTTAGIEPPGGPVTEPIEPVESIDATPEGEERI